MEFEKEAANKDVKYRFMFCKVRRKEIKSFRLAMRDLNQLLHRAGPDGYGTALNRLAVLIGGI